MMSGYILFFVRERDTNGGGTSRGAHFKFACPESEE